MLTYENSFKNLEKAQFILAHFDDFEVYFGGLGTRLVNDGVKIELVVVTDGSMGSSEKFSPDKIKKIRHQEQISALKILNLDENSLQTLNFQDAHLENSMNLILEISKQIRRFQPDLICTHEPDYLITQSEKLQGGLINHRDHRILGECVIDAVYPYSRISNLSKQDNLPPHSVKKIYLSGDQHPSPNIEIKIDDVISTKKQLMNSHQSQLTPETTDQIISEDNLNIDGTHTEKGRFVELVW